MLFSGDERDALTAAVGGLLTRRAAPAQVRLQLDAGGDDESLWREMSELGWMSLMVPEEYDGVGAGLSAAVVVAGGLGSSVVPGPYLSSPVLAATALIHSPNEAARSRWLPRIAAGEVRAAVALSGAGGRVDVNSFSLLLDNDRLTGTVPLVLDGGSCDVLIAGVRSADGPMIVAIEPPFGVNARPSIDRSRAFADLHLDGRSWSEVEVLATGGDVAALLDRIIDVGVVAVAADAMGAANRSFELALQYAKEREQFGRPIGSFQAIKHKLADMYVLARGADAIIEGAAASIDRDDPTSRRRAAVAATFCRTAAAHIAGESVQIHGGIGYTWEHDCHLLLKRTKLDLTLIADTWAQEDRLIEAIQTEKDVDVAEDALATGESEELAAFRAEVRTWLDANAPKDWRAWFDADTETERTEFLREHGARLHAGGYLVPHWPTEFGGGGFNAAEQLVIKQEVRRVGYPPVAAGISYHHVAATLIVHGTDEQREALPRIIEGETWCQGFSEPNAGSDLAALQTRAVRDGDEYVINGQKTWSSGAQRAKWCLLLARTDPTAKKQKGISAFLLDMSLPGIEVRPIRQVTGDSHFSEIFLNDVRVPASCLVGAENEGWSIANTTLATERGSMIIDNHARLQGMLSALCEEAARTPIGEGQTAIEHAAVRAELAQRAAEVEVLGVLAERIVSLTLNHGDMGPEGSIIKLFFSEALQRLTELAVRVRGIASHVDPGDSRRPDSIDWMIDHLESWMWTISAGSNEIQRNIIAERVLGLPREPSFN